MAHNGTYKVLIVEDDSDEAHDVCAALARYGQAHNLDIQISWLRTAVDVVAGERDFDLILLDIGLPGINGMEAAELLREFDPVTPIVFITSLANYAVRGYEVDALGFVVKPVTYSSLSLYLDRAVRDWRVNAERRVSVPTREGTRIIPLGDIVYVEVRNHELIWHLDGGEFLSMRGSLKQAEESFSGAPVLRISKSHLINMNKVCSVHRDLIRMSTGEDLVISRSRRRQTMARLTSYLGSGR